MRLTLGASRVKSTLGFTLLEAVVALAILGLALMAIFDLNAGAIASHAYTKRLTLATILARGKMTDLEQKLHDQGMPADDDEDAGDFSEEGWPGYRWRARILAPKTQNVSTDKVIAALFNLPGGGAGGLDALFSGALGGALGGGASGAAGGAGRDAAGAAAAGGLGGVLPPGASAGSASMGAGLLQGPVTQLVDQIAKSVREVHLTISWDDGEKADSLEVVTHVVSLGPGSDRNLPAGLPGAGTSGTPASGLPGQSTPSPQPRMPGLFNNPIPPGGRVR